MSDNIAPEGKLWVCLACGKTAKDQFGEEGGWDESCTLNSYLYSESELERNADGRVTAIKGAPHG